MSIKLLLLSRVREIPLFNPFMPSELFYLNSLDRFLSCLRGVWSFFLLLPCFIEMPLVNANSIDPDQTPRSAASDLGLHCLPMSHLRDARHKLVNANNADHDRMPRSATSYLGLH